MSRRGWLPGATAVRRLVQLSFLAAFFVLVILARPGGDAEPGPLLKLWFLFDPLILLVTWLTAHSYVSLGLLALATVGLTIVMGRVFCGWICPLGTIHAIAGRVARRFWPDRKRRDHWSPWQLTKYYLLAGFLAMAVLGGHWICVLDPLVLLYRTTATALFPWAQWALEGGSTAIYRADPHVGSWRVTKLTEPVYSTIRDNCFVVQKQAFLGSGLILVLFIVMVAANRWRPRFWCRYLCPLGALLGVFSWRPMLRRAVDRSKCNQCDLCGMACHGAAAAAPGDRWKPAECFGCLNCTESCRRESLGFAWTLPWSKEPAAEAVDVSKRAVCGSIAAGLAGLYLFRCEPQKRAKLFNDLLIRPPGARAEPEFLQRCTSCGLCMKICPTGGLQPTWLEAGLEGLWTPRLVPRIGQCEFGCNLCGQVCPTEAIRPQPIAEKQKGGIGLAAFDTTRCIPYAYGRDCMVCEEHCPIPDKAIYFVEVQVQDRDGQRVTIKQPHVDVQKCIGCGICENVCPLKDRPGVRVFSANETRNPDNRPLLPEQMPY